MCAGGAVCAGNIFSCDALCTHTTPFSRPPLPFFLGKHVQICVLHNLAGAHLHGRRCVCDKQILLQGTLVALLCFTLLHPCPPAPCFPGMMVHLTKDKVPEASTCCRELCMGGTQLACALFSCTVCTACSNHAHFAPCNGVYAREPMHCIHASHATIFNAFGSILAFLLAHLCYLCFGSKHLVPMQPMVNK